MPQTMLHNYFQVPDTKNPGFHLDRVLKVMGSSDKLDLARELDRQREWVLDNDGEIGPIFGPNAAGMFLAVVKVTI